MLLHAPVAQVQLASHMLHLKLATTSLQDVSGVDDDPPCLCQPSWRLSVILSSAVQLKLPAHDAPTGQC